MFPSFAHLRTPLAVLVLASALAGCASLPPPTSELSAAQQAVARADTADADQYAPAEIGSARRALAQAQAAMSSGDDDQARRFALAAAADADLAHARSRGAAARAAHSQRSVEVGELQARLGIDAGGAAPVPVEPAGSSGQHALRLQALAADPRLAGLAALERLQAQQALDAVATARGRDRAAAELLAERRVRAAEVAAHAQALERDVDRLEREFRELQLEASRRDADAARAEAERLRLQAQLQAEQTERLRQQALAEEQARQQAEQALQGAAADQAARLGAARDRELALARQEAELVAGGKLPPARRTGSGDLFTLAGDAFASGQSELTAAAQASVRALAAYIGLTHESAVRVVGHTDSQGDAAKNQALSQRRAEAVRQALVAEGVPGSRIEASGRGAAAPVADNTTAAGRARNRRVEILLPSE
jgi:outer membrane protein OmpA-like peptidoglycan-associated protein